MNPRLKSWMKKKTPPAAWALARTLYYRAKNQTYRKRTVWHTYGGTQLQVCIADPAGAAWYDFDWHPPLEIERLKSGRLTPGARVFELAAHQCVVAMLLAEAVGPRGQVVALEASVHNAAIGERNRKMNGYKNLKILNAAVAETSGRIAFSTGDHVNRGKMDYDGRVWVNSFSIDDLAARYGIPDVLYMDVEGYEANALRGARRTLEQMPDCFVEVHSRFGLEDFGETAESVLSYFPLQMFDLWIRKLGNDDEVEEDFTPLRPADLRLRTRFHLLAFGRLHAAKTQEL